MKKYNYSPLKNEVDIHPKAEKQWTVLWRGINFVFVIFFILAAIVNLNDIDAFLWVPVYSVPSLLSLAIVIKPQITDNAVWQVSCVVHMTLCAAGTLYLLALVAEILFEKVGNPLEHEVGRELGGLLIIEAWLYTCRFTTLGSTEPGKGGMRVLLLVTGILATLPLVVWGLCFVGGLHKTLGHCKDMFRD